MDLEKTLTINRKTYIGIMGVFILIFFIFGLLDLIEHFSWISVAMELLYIGMLTYGIYKYQLKMLDKPVVVTWIGFVFSLVFCTLLMVAMFFL